MRSVRIRGDRFHSELRTQGWTGLDKPMRDALTSFGALQRVSLRC